MSSVEMNTLTKVSKPKPKPRLKPVKKRTPSPTPDAQVEIAKFRMLMGPLCSRHMFGPEIY